MEEKEIKEILIAIENKIELRDKLLIDLTREIALLRLEIKENHNL